MAMNTLKAIEATVSPDGRISMAEPFVFSKPTKVILTVMIDEDDEDEFTEEEIAAIMEAKADRESGNMDAFVPMSEVKARLGIQ